MIAAAIDTGALLKMAYSAAIAGIGVTVVFALAILGATRAGERRAESAGSATAYLALAAVSVVVCIGVVGYGLYLVVHK